MRLTPLHRDKWEFYALVEAEDGDNKCQTCLDGPAPGGREKDLNNLGAVLDFMSKSPKGPRAFGTDICHSVSAGDEGIWQIKKGDLRLLFFYGERNRMIICEELHLKRGQKVDKARVNAAVRLRERYLEAEKNGTLKIVIKGEKP